VKRLVLPGAALLLLPALAFAPARALAEGPVVPPQGGDPVEEIRQASIRLSKALKENEEALAKVARGEAGDPKAVDVDLPKTERTVPSSSPSGGT
jgi:hypothetical protein